MASEQITALSWHHYRFIARDMLMLTSSEQITAIAWHHSRLIECVRG
jgi:hypothetical protein